MQQVLFYTLFLVSGAAGVFIFFRTQLKKISADLSNKVENFVSSLPAGNASGGVTAENTSGLFDQFVTIGRKIESISIPKIEASLPTPVNKEETEKTEILQKRFDNLQVINELGQRVTSSLSLEETFEHLYKTINSMMDAAVVELGVYFWKENRLQTLSSNESKNNNYKTSSEYKNDMAAWCLKNNREIFLDDAEKEFARYVFNPLVLPDGKIAQSVMSFPIYVKEKEMGALTIISFRKNAFNSYHVEMIRSLLPYTAVALQNALIHQELIVTQSQLIHNEKMASIGQLSSGIAHEILNPLNFVNNFSEISIELVNEIKNIHSTEQQSHLQEQLVTNLDKISFHGNRAYGIVKSMMMLSRGGKGEKTQVHINKTVEEFLNIAYQSAVGKFDDYECRIEKMLDPSIPMKQMVAEDFSRVLLNLFNNAFYAMNEKKKKIKASGNSDAIASYEPELIVKTFMVNSMIGITVRDNGTGIPDEIKEKIFLPFFTTKPTGEGTGLGLALSHDIIVKGNQGDLTVRSEISKWSEFKVIIPSA